MDAETRKAAEIKADAISDMIGIPSKTKRKFFGLIIENYHNFIILTGYPDFIQDPKLLDERYNNLTVRNDTYFENNLQLNYYNLIKNLEKINEPVNKTTWSKLPQ